MPDEIPASFDFAEALTRVKAGQHVTRLCWQGYRDRRHLDIWLDGIKRPHLIVRQWHGHWTYWEMKNDDVVAEDWVVWEPPT
jgi:hypothetical protein